MNDPEPSIPRSAPAWLHASLCGGCAHLRVITSAKGSGFALCGKSRDDDRFPRYPPQPVASCSEHTLRAKENHGGS